MPRRNTKVYTGTYSGRSRSPPCCFRRSGAPCTLWSFLKCYFNDTLDTLWKCRNAVSLIAATVVIVLFLPIITRAVYNTSETKILKNMVTSMSREIYVAKTNCDAVCSMHGSLKEMCAQTDTETEPEIEPEIEEPNAEPDAEPNAEPDAEFEEEQDTEPEPDEAKVCDPCRSMEDDETPSKWESRKNFIKRLFNPKYWCD